MSGVPLYPGRSEAQQRFIDALEAAGARRPGVAVPHSNLPPLPARELEALLDSGYVREAKDNAFYVYGRVTPVPTPYTRLPYMRPPFSWPRFVKVLAFWLLILLIPIILIQITGSR